MDTSLQDVRYGLRNLAKSRGFTIVAVLALALGIGANTAIFSFIDAVVLRPIPVENPRQLVLFTWKAHQKPKMHGHIGYDDCDIRDEDCSFSVPFFRTVQQRNEAFSGLGAFAGPTDIDVSGYGTARIARGTFVSGDFFSTLGVKTIIGRPIGPSDDSTSGPPAVVLSFAYWQSSFASDPSVVGRVIRINNVPATIVGVADPRFTNLTPGKTQDLYMPLSLADRVQNTALYDEAFLPDPEVWWVTIIGRLRRGTSISQAQAAASTVFRNEMLYGSAPLSREGDDPAVFLWPARDGLNGAVKETASGLYLVMLLVALVLVIACADVAGLTIARSAWREKEMAVRLALGATRSRIIRQVLTESVLLSVAGGGLGTLVAVWGITAISKLVANGDSGPFPLAIRPDWRVLAFTVTVTLGTGVLFGLAPALRSANLDLSPSLKTAASFAAERHPGRLFRLGDVLVVVQVTLSMAVLVGAGLMVRTLYNLRTLDPGFDTQNVILFGVNPKIAGYTDRQIAQLYTNLQERFAALPGVISASYSRKALLSGGWSGDRVHLDGTPPEARVEIAILPVGPDFFSTMRIPLVAGRTLTQEDFIASAEVADAELREEAAREAASKGAPSPQISPSPHQAEPKLGQTPSKPGSLATPVIVNQSLARKFSANHDPLGTTLGGPDWPIGPVYTVVGVIGDIKYASLRGSTRPTMYWPQISDSAHFELRSSVDPTLLMSAVRETVSSIDNNLPLFAVSTQTEQVDQLLVQERLMARVSGFLGVAALVLSCIGLYGLLSFNVARRTRELGIRIALGAHPRNLLRMVVYQGTLLALVGTAIGIGVAMAVTRLMTRMLYDVHAGDPATTISVAILQIGVALLACYIPARRAMRVDPMVALRSE
ncbi:MAG TPA: ABC transporter permease [Blastocatellia bacterium]